MKVYVFQWISSLQSKKTPILCLSCNLQENIEDEEDEEMDDENDYGNNYFDDGGNYLDEDDNLDDGPTY